MPQQLARSLFSRTVSRNICRLKPIRSPTRGNPQTTFGFISVVLETPQGTCFDLLTILLELKQPKRRKTLNTTLTLAAAPRGIFYSPFTRPTRSTRGRPLERLKAVCVAKQLHGLLPIPLKVLLHRIWNLRQGPRLLWNRQPLLVRQWLLVFTEKRIGTWLQLRHPQRECPIPYTLLATTWPNFCTG